MDYEENLQNFIEKTVKHAESKKKEFYNIFDCKESDIYMGTCSLNATHAVPEEAKDADR